MLLLNTWLLLLNHTWWKKAIKWTINKRQTMHPCAKMDFVQFVDLVLIEIFFGYDSLLLYLLLPYTFFRLSSVVVLIVCKLLHYNNITAHCKLQPEIHTHRCAFPHKIFDHGPGRSLLVFISQSFQFWHSSPIFSSSSFWRK